MLISKWEFSGALVLMFWCLTSHAVQPYEYNLTVELQYDQLMEPTTGQQLREQDGGIFIYSGLKDSDIQLAMDRHNQRIESMMFVNVVWTDDDGEPLIDPTSGQLITDDDC